ncbi:MAG: hypothetical protein FE048_01380 [Thermoplasmata archaeon]|nr:MAG: hypothetical protein FE048_01380 [Thermoplasmata archaeon]
MKERKYVLSLEHIKIMNPIVIELENDYFMRGSRANIGTFNIVTIEWNHPNFGYFADYMVWIKSLHMKKWEPFPIVRGSENYTLAYFLKKYPDFKSLFEERDLIDYIIG